MKGLKIFAFVVAGIVLLLAIVLALALTPSVQTWAVRKAVAGQPGMDIQVAKVAAGFSAADLEEVNAEMEFEAGPLVSLDLQDVHVDVSAPALNGNGGPSVRFRLGARSAPSGSLTGR